MGIPYPGTASIPEYPRESFVRRIWRFLVRPGAMAEKPQKGSEAKESIVLFCRIVKYGDVYPKLSPDHVRQAKFDKPEVVDVLLELLWAVICYPNDSSTSDRKMIRKSLQTCRYPRVHLLYNKTGKVSSSREILLAIAWYIHTAKVIDCVRTKAMYPIDILEMLIKGSGKPTMKKTFEYTPHTLEDQLNYISWLIAQMRLLNQQTVSIEMANAKLKHLISSSVKPELGEDPFLLYFLRTPSLYNEYEKMLERKVLLLQSCMQWKKIQHVFWLWMDSVLACAPPLAEFPYSSANSSRRWPAESLVPILQKKLQDLEKELNIMKKGSESDGNVLTGQLPPEQRLDSDKEIMSLRRRLLSVLQQPRLKCIKDVQRSYPSDGYLQLRHEHYRLVEKNSGLIKELDKNRECATRRLESVGFKFPAAVLIPPEIPDHCK